MLRSKVQHNLERLVQFLEPYKDFVNVHMVDFIRQNHFEKFISKEIRDELNSVDKIDKAIEFFWNHENETSPEFENLSNFITNTKSYYLDKSADNICLSTNQFLKKLKELGIPVEQGLSLKIKDFLSEKKNHEVSIASAFVANLADKDGLILDIGDGKGYLSSRINLEYGLDVLGIDGNPTNTEMAQKRSSKLKKFWKGLVKREAEKSDVPVEPLINETNSNSAYKTQSQMIFSDTNLEPLIEESFPGKTYQEVCLVGLHTCGNLAANSLKIYINNERIRKLCNIGCCYHLLVEEFSKDEFFNDNYWQENSKDICFPMSDYLREQKFYLGRNARMIGAHSYDRVLHEKEYPNISLFYRALFELILKSNGIAENFRLGKIKFNDFHDYLKKA